METKLHTGNRVYQHPPPNPFLFASKDVGVGQAFSHKR